MKVFLMKPNSIVPCNHKYDIDCRNCVMNQFYLQQELYDTNEALNELLELEDNYD